MHDHACMCFLIYIYIICIYVYIYICICTYLYIYIYTPIKMKSMGGRPVWNFNSGFHFSCRAPATMPLGSTGTPKGGSEGTVVSTPRPRAMTAMVAPSSMGIQSYYVTWHMIFQALGALRLGIVLLYNITKAQNTRWMISVRALPYMENPFVYTC